MSYLVLDIYCKSVFYSQHPAHVTVFPCMNGSTCYEMYGSPFTCTCTPLIYPTTLQLNVKNVVSWYLVRFIPSIHRALRLPDLAPTNPLYFSHFVLNFFFKLYLFEDFPCSTQVPQLTFTFTKLPLQKIAITKNCRFIFSHKTFINRCFNFTTLAYLLYEDFFMLKLQVHSKNSFLLKDAEKQEKQQKRLD